MNTLPAHNYKALNDLLLARMKAQQEELKMLSATGEHYNKVVNYLLAHPILDDHSLNLYSSSITLHITAKPSTTYAWFDKLSSDLCQLLGRPPENVPDIVCANWSLQISREMTEWERSPFFSFSTRMIIPEDGLPDLVVRKKSRQVTTSEYVYEIYTTPVTLTEVILPDETPF